MKSKFARFGTQVVTILTIGWLRSDGLAFWKCCVVWGAFVMVYSLTLIAEQKNKVV